MDENDWFSDEVPATPRLSRRISAIWNKRLMQEYIEDRNELSEILCSFTTEDYTVLIDDNGLLRIDSKDIISVSINKAATDLDPFALNVGRLHIKFMIPICNIGDVLLDPDDYGQLWWVTYHGKRVNEI